ncbi:MAG: hypothetical protein ACREFX_13505, partial [Opitutaceae bacterium]
MSILPRRGLRLGRVAALLLCLLALAGCSTQGLRTGEEHFNKSCGETVPDSANGDPATAFVKVRECIRVEAVDFQNTTLGQVDNSELLSYGYTGLAAGGAGALAFDSAKAALKGLGLAAGTAAAFGSVWSPSRT